MILLDKLTSIREAAIHVFAMFTSSGMALYHEMLVTASYLIAWYEVRKFVVKQKRSNSNSNNNTKKHTQEIINWHIDTSETYKPFWVETIFGFCLSLNLSELMNKTKQKIPLFRKKPDYLVK